MMISLNDLSRLLNPIKRKLFLLVGKSLLAAVNNTGAVGFHPAGDRKNPQRLSTEWFGKLTDIEHSQPYGFESYPIVGTAKVILLSPDGSRGNTFAIMVQDDEKRPTDGEEGETIHYGPLDNPSAAIPTYQRVIMKADGSVEIKAGKKTEIIIEKDGLVTIKSGDDSSITIANDSDIITTSKGKTVINATGDVEINTDGAAKIVAGGNIEVAADGNLIMSAMEATLDCDLIVTGGDVGADGISLKTHFHQGNLGFPTGTPIQSGGGTAPGSLPTADAAGEITDGLGVKSKNHTHGGVEPGSGSTGTAT